MWPINMTRRMWPPGPKELTLSGTRINRANHRAAKTRTAIARTNPTMCVLCCKNGISWGLSHITNSLLHGNFWAEKTSGKHDTVVLPGKRWDLIAHNRLERFLTQAPTSLMGSQDLLLNVRFSCCTSSEISDDKQWKKHKCFDFVAKDNREEQHACFQIQHQKLSEKLWSWWSSLLPSRATSIFPWIQNSPLSEILPCTLQAI